MSAEHIAWIVRKEFGLTVSELFGTTRKRKAVEARSIVYDLMQREGHSKSAIARAFGKDHSTVISALQRLDDLLVTDKEFKATYERIKVAASEYEKAEER